MMAGENVSALAKELGVLRKDLYKWRERFRCGGPNALRSRGRPPKLPPSGTVPVMGAELVMSPAVTSSAPPSSDALSKAEKRIVELERKIGRQELELDFFRRALRHFKERRRQKDAPGVTTSTRSSEQ
jgi:transposase-like protein